MRIVTVRLTLSVPEGMDSKSVERILRIAIHRANGYLGDEGFSLREVVTADLEKVSR